MTAEVNVYNTRGVLIDRKWVYPGRMAHIPQYLSELSNQTGSPAFYYKIYCARNNAYTLIERVDAIERQGKNGERIFMAKKTGEGLIMLRKNQATKPLPIRSEVHGPIENYRFVHKGPKLNLRRKI